MVSESRFRIVPWVLVGILGTLWLTKGVQGGTKAQVIDQTPTLLESFRKIGFLQTAEMNMSEAFQFATHKEAGGLAAMVPGADRLVQGVTTNSVWVQANGKVTAGIDLSKAELRVVGDTVFVKLPRVTVQRPDVDLKLMNNTKGVFWKDDEILLKATSAARQRFGSAVSRLHINERALTEAGARITRLVGEITPKRVVIERS